MSRHSKLCKESQADTGTAGGARPTTWPLRLTGLGTAALFLRRPVYGQKVRAPLTSWPPSAVHRHSPAGPGDRAPGGQGSPAQAWAPWRPLASAWQPHRPLAGPAAQGSLWCNLCGGWHHADCCTEGEAVNLLEQLQVDAVTPAASALLGSRPPPHAAWRETAWFTSYPQQSRCHSARQAPTCASQGWSRLVIVPSPSQAA